MQEDGEGESGLVLPAQCCWNSHVKDGVGTPSRRDWPPPRPGSQRRHSLLEEPSEGSVPGAQEEWREVTGQSDTDGGPRETQLGTRITCWGRGAARADGVGADGGSRLYPHACVPVLGHSPTACRPFSRLFAAQPSSYVQPYPLPRGLQPQDCTIPSPAVHGHPSSCLQLPRSALIIPLQLSVVTIPVICNVHPPLWASGKACSR